MNIAIINATLVNEGKQTPAHVLVSGQRVACVQQAAFLPEVLATAQVIDARGQYLLPGLIDTHVHFREPGLTHKGDWDSETRAAVAGGVTSVVDMPNTLPPTVTKAAALQKLDIAAQNSLTNYHCFVGATAENVAEIALWSRQEAFGVKLFMGSSTGNMLLDNEKTLHQLFAECPMPMVAHCEHEATIRHNLAQAQQRFGNDIPFELHPEIRSREACLKSTELAVKLAQKYGTRLHVAHISTQEELELFAPNATDITAETCVHYLWFSSGDYEQKQEAIKCNPAIKTACDRDALQAAVTQGKISTLATDHAPHLWSEKQGNYLQSPSGLPLIQHALPALLQLCEQRCFSLTTLVERACHGPARLFGIAERGFIRQGYFADLVLVRPHAPQKVEQSNILYRCGWSPFEGETFSHTITHTLVNGHLAFANGVVCDEYKGERLKVL